MITFALYTAIILLATSSWLKIMHIATQSGMIFGKWQNVLNKFDEKGFTVLYKWLGGCEICTSAFFSFLSIGIYMAFMYEFKSWIVTGWVWNILWLTMYWSIGTVLNLYFMVKLFDKNSPQN